MMGYGAIVKRRGRHGCPNCRRTTGANRGSSQHELDIFFHHGDMWNVKLAHFCLNCVSKVRLQMIDMDREIRRAEFVGLASQELGCEMLGQPSKRHLCIGIRCLDECRLQVRHGGGCMSDLAGLVRMALYRIVPVSSLIKYPTVGTT